MSSARPKRAPDLPLPGEAAPPDSNKKPRFDYRNPSTLAADAPEEDAILEADVIGKAQRQTKRNAVKIDGYESDSSEENFDARAEEKARQAKETEARSKDEEEADMFADLEEDFKDGDDDEDLNREGKKKKSVKFLEEHEIEGQVANSKSGGHVSADFTLNGKDKGKAVDQDEESSSESGGDEERDKIDSDMDEELGAGSKKKHAPKLDAFNMKQENEEGRFDDEGNYVRKANDPDAVHDTWLEGLSKKDMKKAKAAEEKREEERRRRALADDQVLTSDILGTLITRMERGETVLEALARLGKAKKKEKPKPKWQKNKRKANSSGENGDAMDVDPAQKEEDPAEKRRREAVEAITGAADQLMTRGDTDIYEKERELLVRQYKRETGDDWIDPPKEEVADEVSETKMWEYRWSDARDGGEKHGPYDGQTMKAWNDAGYFGEGVEFRLVGQSGWDRTVNFV
ncbi:GYF domain-containing protein [Macrophomina phaseolina MS6]|uniref:GYF domain-containing protein n=1 Tax=Macrophomina phaseolina (strain MS6) TaxID=1126212 RepID=K2RZK9_MACPH|nr:GYF domain-containing protein [Macrophomina phaseolina MS6]